MQGIPKNCTTRSTVILLIVFLLPFTLRELVATKLQQLEDG